MIPFLDLKAINAQYLDKLIVACTQVVDSGWYICGKQVDDFERHFAHYCGTQYAIGVANGLDALILTLRAWKELGKLNEGDEVIVPSNTSPLVKVGIVLSVVYFIVYPFSAFAVRLITSLYAPLFWLNVGAGASISS